MQGRTVRQLVKASFEAGRHFINWNARGLDSGVYISQLVVDDRETRRLKLTIVR